MINAITFLPDTYKPDLFKSISLYEAIEAIKSGRFVQKIDSFRQGLIEKNRLPSFSFGGVYKNSVKNESLIQYSNLFHFDIDKLEDVAAAKKELMAVPGLVFCFVSPSGNGLKGALLIQDGLIANDGDFKAYYPWLEDYLHQYGFVIDKSCKDVRRLCFVSHDAELFFNPGALAIEPEKTAPTKKTTPPKSPTNKTDYPKIASALWSLSPDIDYNEWLAVSMALKSEGEQYHALWLSWSQSGRKWKESDAKKWDALHPDTITIGTLFHHAKEVGWRYAAPIQHAPSITADVLESEAVDEAQDWHDTVSQGIDYLIPFDCLARKIQLWILKRSRKKQPALALLSALTVIGVIQGRSYKFDGIKGNIYSLGVLGSGMGKEEAQNCLVLLLEALELGSHIETSLASGAALFDFVYDKGSCVCLIDEAGHFYKNTGYGSNQFSKEIIPMLTMLYTKATSQYRDKARAGKPGNVITEPNLCFFGATTEGQLMDSMKTSEVADGSLARYFVVFGDENARRNKDYCDDKALFNEIVLELKRMRNKCDMDFNSNGGRGVDVELHPDYLAKKDAYADYFDEKGFEVAGLKVEKSKFKPFYMRLLVRAMQIAGLIDKCASIDVLDWCVSIVEQSNEAMIKKFLHLSSDNEMQSWCKLIEGKIKEAGKKGIASRDLTRLTQKAPPHVRKAYLAELLECDLIFTVPKRINGSQKPTTYYFWKK